MTGHNNSFDALEIGKLIQWDMAIERRAKEELSKIYKGYCNCQACRATIGAKSTNTWVEITGDKSKDFCPNGIALFWWHCNPGSGKMAEVKRRTCA